jgi:HD-like signal output (HDOD) protein/CheY-like chemotaxis protein
VPALTPPDAPRRRILFVDDEAQVLDGLKNLMRKQRPVWDMDFALGGHAALAAFGERPFDVVVSDMRMPEMDGTELLSAIRDRYPATTRIVLSGHAERDAISRAMMVSHQFLAKPCDANMLKQVIARVCGLHALLRSDDLRQMVGRVDKLPSVPELYTELVAALAKPTTTVTDIAAIVGRDPAMAAKILQLVNSSYFGLPRPLQSIDRAVGYLGSDMIRSLALTVGIFARLPAVPCPGFSNAAVQERAVLGGRLARAFLGADAARASDAFAAALVRDVGMLILVLGSTEAYAPVLAAAAKTGGDLTDLERAAFGVSHAEVGAYLLGVWGLPAQLIETVAHHHEPTRIEHDDYDVALAVHVAALMADAVTMQKPFAPTPEVKVLLGDRLKAWRKQADGLLRDAGYRLSEAA